MIHRRLDFGVSTCNVVTVKLQFFLVGTLNLYIIYLYLRSQSKKKSFSTNINLIQVNLFQSDF